MVVKWLKDGLEGYVADDGQVSKEWSRRLSISDVSKEWYRRLCVADSCQVSKE